MGPVCTRTGASAGIGFLSAGRAAGHRLAPVSQPRRGAQPYDTVIVRVLDADTPIELKFDKPGQLRQGKSVCTRLD
jgi:hypothetical protein